MFRADHVTDINYVQLKAFRIIDILLKNSLLLHEKLQMSR